MKKVTGFIVLALLLCTSFTMLAFAATDKLVLTNGGFATVMGVEDGETITVQPEGTEDTAYIRLIGVDAKSNANAAAYLKTLVGQNVSLSFDPAVASPTDTYYNVMYVTIVSDSRLVNKHMTSDAVRAASKVAHKNASMFTNAVYTPTAKTNSATATPIAGSAGTTAVKGSSFSWNDNNWYLRNGRYYYFMNGLYYIYNSDGTYSPTNLILTPSEKASAPPANYLNSTPSYYFDPYYYNSYYYYGSSYYNDYCYDRYDYNYYDKYDNYYYKTYYDSYSKPYYYDRYDTKVYYTTDTYYYYYNNPSSYYYNDPYYYYDDYYYYNCSYPYNLYRSSGIYSYSTYYPYGYWSH